MYQASGEKWEVRAVRGVDPPPASPPDISVMFRVSCLHVYKLLSQPRECFGCVEFLSCPHAREAVANLSLSLDVPCERGHVSRRWLPKVLVEPGMWPGRNQNESASVLAQLHPPSTLDFLLPLPMTILTSCHSLVGISRRGWPVHSTSPGDLPLTQRNGAVEAMSYHLGVRSRHPALEQ